jgi:hypothetical protein
MEKATAEVCPTSHCKPDIFCQETGNGILCGASAFVLEPNQTYPKLPDTGKMCESESIQNECCVGISGCP